jgi:hypothetical protein
MRKNAIRMVIAGVLLVGMSSVQLWAASPFPPPMEPPVAVK